MNLTTSVGIDIQACERQCDYSSDLFRGSPENEAMETDEQEAPLDFTMQNLSSTFKKIKTPFTHDSNTRPNLVHNYSSPYDSHQNYSQTLLGISLPEEVNQNHMMQYQTTPSRKISCSLLTRIDDRTNDIPGHSDDPINLCIRIPSEESDLIRNQSLAVDFSTKRPTRIFPFNKNKENCESPQLPQNNFHVRALAFQELLQFFKVPSYQELRKHPVYVLITKMTRNNQHKSTCKYARFWTSGSDSNLHSENKELGSSFHAHKKDSHKIQSYYSPRIDGRTVSWPNFSFSHARCEERRKNVVRKEMINKISRNSVTDPSFRLCNRSAIYNRRTKLSKSRIGFKREKLKKFLYTTSHKVGKKNQDLNRKTKVSLVKNVHCDHSYYMRESE